MADKWFAECLPCKWEETHDSQAGAIDAAMSHVADLHAKVSPEQRATRKMGHVQFRSEIAPLTSALPTAGLSPGSSEHPSGPTVEEDKPAVSSLPEGVKFSSAKHPAKKTGG